MNIKYLFSIAMAGLLFSCAAKQKTGDSSEAGDKGKIAPSSYTVEPSAFSEAEKAKLDTATFASGCFWCSEAVFERVQGVKSVVSGYSGGTQPNPTYQQVSAGNTNYAESIEVYYDPSEVSYETLLEVFFDSHDATQVDGQGPDIGKQYRSDIFYHNKKQQEEATAYKEKLDSSGKYNKPIATLITPYDKFYMAEDYHQNYYEHNQDNPYVINVSKPKVEKFVKQHKDLLKDNVKV